MSPARVGLILTNRLEVPLGRRSTARHRPASLKWPVGSFELEAESVHTLGRIVLSDPEQLRYASREEYVFVTRNRDDFIRFTAEFFRK
jgi:hypothetical protein